MKLCYVCVATLPTEFSNVLTSLCTFIKLYIFAYSLFITSYEKNIIMLLTLVRCTKKYSAYENIELNMYMKEMFNIWKK